VFSGCIWFRSGAPNHVSTRLVLTWASMWHQSPPHLGHTYATRQKAVRHHPCPRQRLGELTDRLTAALTIGGERACRNCEDIAMQFAVSNATNLPPVWVQGRYTDAGGLDGISTTGIMHHRKVRPPPISVVFPPRSAALVGHMDSEHLPWWTLGSRCHRGQWFWRSGDEFASIQRHRGKAVTDATRVCRCGTSASPRLRRRTGACRSPPAGTSPCGLATG
jgi:hypothetical protein